MTDAERPIWIIQGKRGLPGGPQGWITLPEADGDMKPTTFDECKKWLADNPRHPTILRRVVNTETGQAMNEDPVRQ